MGRPRKSKANPAAPGPIEYNASSHAKNKFYNVTITRRVSAMDVREAAIKGAAILSRTVGLKAYERVRFDVTPASASGSVEITRPIFLKSEDIAREAIKAGS